MHRNVARAYSALWAEHKRIRRIYMKILARGDQKLERRLLQADLDDNRHHREVVEYEYRLSRPQRRRVLKLTSYGRKIEQVMETLLRL
jgi:hypothetical protein